MVKNRIKYIDCYKMLIITAVVFTHCGVTFVEQWLIFFLPAAFILSGIVTKVNNISFKKFFNKKVYRILVPFWIFILVAALEEIIRASYVGYGNFEIALPSFVQGIYGSAHNLPIIGSFGQYVYDIMSYKDQVPGYLDVILPSNCQLWYLPALFTANLLFYPIAKIKKRKVPITCLFIVLFLACAGIETIPGFYQLPYALGRGFFGAALMLAGHLISNYKLLDKNKVILIVLAVVGFGLAVLATYLGSNAGSLPRSVYGSYGFLSVFVSFIGGLGGFLAIIMILVALDKSPATAVKNFMAKCGEYTMFVFLTHFVLIFILDYAAIEVFSFPLQPDLWYMSLFPDTLIIYKVSKSIICLVVLFTICMIREKFFLPKGLKLLENIW